MKTGGYIAILAIIAVIAFVPVVSDSSEVSADVIPVYEYNCNSYDLSFKYIGGTVGNIVVEWESEGVTYNGDIMEIRQLPPAPSSSNGWKVVLDPEDVKQCKIVYIKQTVRSLTTGEEDCIKFKINMLTPPPVGETFKVIFFDGYRGSVLLVDEISSTRYVPAGQDFVKPPEPPVRDGYSFYGWFIDNDISKPFISTQPVESNLNVFARWVQDGAEPPTPDNPGEPDNPDSGLPEPGDSKLMSITVAGDYKTDYTVGETLNTLGLGVYALYSNGARVEVTSECTFTPTKFTITGVNTVNVSYMDQKTSFTVSVVEDFTPDVPVDPDNPPDNPDKPNKDEGTDLTDYLLIVVGVLLVVLIAVVILRSRH